MDKRLHYLLALTAVLSCAFMITTVQAETTTPLKFVYHGNLLDSDQEAITTAHTIRFSMWVSADYLTGDVDSGDGSINTSASNYKSWQEEHTVTPGVNGFFNVELGSVNALPDFSTLTPEEMRGLYMQIEVKVQGAADTTYEVLDIDGSDDTNDRSPLLSVPFSLNADLIDGREIGTSSGNVVVLQSGSLLDIDHMPGGTNSGKTIIDYDDTETEEIVLQFGNTLEKTLLYDIDDTIFRFNDDVDIDGNLTVNLINGIDITTLGVQSPTHLKASSGAGLTAMVAAGDYRLGGVVTYYAGGSVNLTDETTNYIFFTDAGVQVNTTGFPTDENHVQIATVVTAGGVVTSVADRRILNDDDRESTVVRTLQPTYEHASYTPDGSNNVGQLVVNHSGGILKNYYKWTSTRSSLQDYDIVVPVILAEDFVSWGATPITLEYHATVTSGAQADVYVYDTTNTLVTISGGTDLTNQDWNTASITFSGSPTWTPGEQMTIVLRVHAQDEEEMHIGDLTLTTVEYEDD